MEAEVSQSREIKGNNKFGNSKGRKEGVRNILKVHYMLLLEWFYETQAHVQWIYAKQYV